MKPLIRLLAGLAMLVLSVGAAQAEFLTFTQLDGLTGGFVQGTKIYRADLSTLTSVNTIASIRITDDYLHFPGGGDVGQFSGFDLDAIRLSDTLVTTSAAAKGVSSLGLFNFTTAGTTFQPGIIRTPPFDPRMFGTLAPGNLINNSVATLSSFDAISTTTIPGADGYLSMGDGGSLIFNLTSAISKVGKYLYLGEVGDNGERIVAEVFSEPIIGNNTGGGPTLPEPSTVALLVTGALGLVAIGRRRLRTQ